MENTIEDLEKRIIDFESKKSEEQLCVVCLDQKPIYLNKNCGHLTLCELCMSTYKGACPICNKTGKYMKLYMP